MALSAVVPVVSVKISHVQLPCVRAFRRGPARPAYPISKYARPTVGRFGRAWACGWLLLGALFVDGGARVLAQAPAAPRYESAAVDKVPELKKPLRIKYPSAVRKKGGEVTLRFLVTKEGAVKELTVLRFTHDEMVEPVYAAYEVALYTPGMKGGQAVDTWVEVTETAK